MNKSLKGVAIAAAAMVTVGLLMTGIGFMAGGNQPFYIDRDGIHVGNGAKDFIGNTEVIKKDLDAFSSINTELDLYKVELIPSDKYAIEATFNSKYGKPEFKIENDTLFVNEKDHKRFSINVDIFGFKAFSNKNDLGVKIYYPENAKLKNIVIHGDASDLSFDNLTAENAEFDVDLGRLDLSNLTAGTIIVKLDSGDCSLKNIKADELTTDVDLGKTTLEGAELGKLKMKADSGDVSITDVTWDYGDFDLDLGKLSAKEVASNGLKVRNDSGDINVQGTLLGNTDITCNLGKVTVDTGVAKEQFDYELNTDMGSVSIDGGKVSNSIASSNNAKNTLKIANDMGDINVNFN